MIRSAYVCLAVIVLPFAAAAQNWDNEQDNQFVHFGFMFQYISSEFKIQKKTSWRDPYFDADLGMNVTDSLYSISSKSKPGFGLGFVSDFRLGGNADLRFTPGLAFTDRIVNYEYAPRLSNNTLTVPVTGRVVQATMIDLPVGIKIKSDIRHNFRGYLLLGAKYSTNIVSKKKTDDAGFATVDKLLKNKKNYFSYEAGIGFDLYFEFFKMSPELKFSQSMHNVLKPDMQPYAYPLNRLFLRNLQFSLFFE
ncbi:outer membrane beta-barrel protein [Hufsiella ginkgonis]|uniref:PorT family protein n=1 Tax=Hufsiella ginkgonis TaxID=2695274 RepID=A0A7K1Y3C5_9SPHI|nr:outer membrane beta-barrel protein [Hufsiella ginkgonis]MXV17793.1 PorT family protein [Hufsiella ginkgonis]